MTTQILRRTRETLFALIAEKSRRLLRYANHVTCHSTMVPITRPFLAVLESEASCLEEVLDHYGARTSRTWSPYRETISTTKNIGRVCYILLHIYHRIPAYHLGGHTTTFSRETEQTLRILAENIRSVCVQLLECARACEIPIPTEPISDADLLEKLPPGHFPHDLQGPPSPFAEKTAARLATAFLNLAGEMRKYPLLRTHEAEVMCNYAAEHIREEDLRILELRAHNLETTYDTYIQDTPTEELDINLVTLRGQLATVFHLLEASTITAHYYTRHLSDEHAQHNILRNCINPNDCLHILLNYALNNIRRFLETGADICRAVLKKYVTNVTREVPIPHYRGFHVRPSTLVAQIVQHYGTDVKLELEGETYDAGLPLELFRANEALNRKKRRILAERLDGMGAFASFGHTGTPTDILKRLLLNMAEKGLIIIYGELDLDTIDTCSVSEGENGICAFVVETIARLLVLGKLDICMDITATLIGDERPIDDIAILAGCGYGEDRFGHNIPLPPELSYLHR